MRGPGAEGVKGKLTNLSIWVMKGDNRNQENHTLRNLSGEIL